MTAPVIELGLDRSVPADRDRLAPPPRWFAVVALGLALLAGGSAPPAQPLRPLLTLTGSVGQSLALSRDSLYVVGEVAGQPQLTAYRLPDGRRRWRRSLSRPVGTVWLQAGVIGVPEPEPDRLSFFDPATGRLLWRLDRLTELVGISGGHVLVARPSTGWPDRLDAIDVRSGRLVWTYPLPSAGMGVFLPPGRPDRFGQFDSAARARGDRAVLVAADGTTTVVASQSGLVLATRRLDLAARSTGVELPDGLAWLAGPGLNIVGDQLVLSAVGPDGRSVVGAYDLDSLRERWRVSSPTPVEYATGCGPVLCLLGRGGLTVADLATGTIGWSTTRWVAGGWQAGTLLVSAARPYTEQAVLDPRTGLRLLNLNGWSAPLVAADVDRGTVLVARQLGGPEYRLEVGWLDPDGPAIRPLGSLVGAVDTSCRHNAHYLACTTVDLQVRVWRYEPRRTVPTAVG